MKILMNFSMVALFLAGTASFAGVCDGVTLSGEVQIIPLNGTTGIIGRLPTKDLTGADTNPVKAEANSDGSISLSVYETVVPSHLGQKVADLGQIEFAEGEPTCTLIWTSKDKTRTLELITTSPQGDLILSDFGTGQGMYGVRAPTLIIKKIAK